ncbi:MAG TPA: hypothetical protein VLV49_10290 [Terriglobales bacterium]|nr:hypothetical protein [Terriglobales bacterium]
MAKPAVVNFAQALAAVLLGNLAYFLLFPYLPAWARHDARRIDLGLLLDFCLCALLFAVIKSVTGRSRARS